jgi:tungstate transport system substrate-binding protein
VLQRLVAAVAVAALLANGCVGEKKQSLPRVVRAAVIGGMTMTGLWDEISRMFEAETGYKVEVVATGPRPLLAEAFQQGKADLLTMHSGDITTDLVAQGYGINMRPWTHNDLVIVGPKADPAGIRGMRDGAEALKRIAQAQANYVDFRGIGSREVAHALWKKAGISPEGKWLLKDESSEHLDILSFAQKSNAYVIVGRMPVLFEKLKAADMEILVENDPAMRRPYIVMEANPGVFPNANHAGAKALSDFLLSKKAQSFLAQFGAAQHGDVPLFHPVRSGKPARQ